MPCTFSVPITWRNFGPSSWSVYAAAGVMVALAEYGAHQSRRGCLRCFRCPVDKTVNHALRRLLQGVEAQKGHGNASLSSSVSQRNELYPQHGRKRRANFDREYADSEIRDDDAKRQVEVRYNHAVEDGTTATRSRALQHRVNSRGGRQANMLRVDCLLEADRPAAGQRLIRMYRERQTVPAIGQMLRSRQVGTVPTDAGRCLAVAQLTHDIAREPFFNVDLDVLVRKLSHEGSKIFQQRFRNRGSSRDQPPLALDPSVERQQVIGDAVYLE
jgi:hypothetical protein